MSDRKENYLELALILLELALERLAVALLWFCIDLPAWCILQAEKGLDAVFGMAERVQ